MLKDSFLLKYLSLLLLREDKVPVLEPSFPRKVRKVTPLTFSNMKRRKKNVTYILLQLWLMDEIVLQFKYLKQSPYALFIEMEKNLPQYMAIHLTHNRYLNRSAESHSRDAHPLVIKGTLGI